MYDIVGKRNWYFAFSALITIPGLIFIALGGLKPSVDYTGGTVWQVRYAERPTAVEVHAALVELGYPEAVVREVEHRKLRVRVGVLELDLEQEAVELTLRKREDALVLVRVLRRDYEEGVGELVRLAVDCHLAFLHRFEESGLGARRCAVDLVR